MENKLKLNDFLFLPDVSGKSGAGHFFRCLSLAKILRKDFSCHFSFFSNESFFLDILLDLKIGFLPNEKVKDHLFKITIFDTYKLSTVQINQINSSKFVMINDYKKDLLDIDLSIYPSFEDNYRSDKVLSGLKYSIVQNHFRNARNKYRIKKKVRYILLNFGFADKRRISIKILKMLRKISNNLDRFKVGIIFGSLFTGRNKLVQEIVRCSFEVELFDSPNNVDEILLKSDLVIGAGGVGLLERACIGVPSITIYVSENQKGQTLLFSKNKATISFNYSDLISKKFSKIIESIFYDYKSRKEISKNSRRLVDGRGSERVCYELRKKIYYEK